MTLFGTFLESLVPIQDEKEEVAVKDQIYREDKYMHNENFSPSPKAYGRRHTFVKKMGYPRYGPLNHNLDASSEPLDHAKFGCKSKKPVGLGFEKCKKHTNPLFEQLESDDEPEYMPDLTNQQDMCEDWVPSTNLLWGYLDSLVSHEIIANLEQESVALDDIEA